jgi:hypothetical protein
MKNIRGKHENLELYHSNGEIGYEYLIFSNGIIWEQTWNSKGEPITFCSSNGLCFVGKKVCNEGTHEKIKNKIIPLLQNYLN